LNRIGAVSDDASHRKGDAMLPQSKFGLAAGGDAVGHILDAIPALVAYIDNSLHAKFLNQAFAAWFGRPVSELENMHIADILGADDFRCARS
jgi:PAS domain-containing protein